MSLLLIIPEKSDPERDRVADAWMENGGRAERLDRFWEPPQYDRNSVRLYGNDTFCLVVAQKLGLSLLSPADDLLLHLPYSLVKRELRVVPLRDAESIPFPYFVKPLIPKQFRAAVYQNATELLNECKGLEDSALLLASEIVLFECEVRAFILNAKVLDAAIYEGEATLSDAFEFLSKVVDESVLPSTCVLDVGYIKDRGWSVIEANATWGAGLNGCSPNKVISAIAAATYV
jgi:hypothetical protein